MDITEACQLFDTVMNEKSSSIERCSTGIGNYVFIVSTHTAKYVLRCATEINAYNNTVHWLSRLQTCDIPIPKVLDVGRFENYEYLILSYTSALSFLNGSLVLLIVVGSIKFLPFASKSGTNAMLQLSNEIEEAAIIVGVPWWKRMVKVLFPIQKSSFISGYLLPFVSCMRELTLFVLLTGSSTILTAVLQNYEKYDCTQISNGINLIIILSVLIINVVVNKLTGASIDKGVGG